MNAVYEPIMLARITWDDPETGEPYELLLAEGAAASIGRLETNDICIREHHVSRQHAIINYRDGVFLITDLGSANGVFVNDQRLTEPFPLAAGDEIRLYVPLLHFSAVMDDEARYKTAEHSTMLNAASPEGAGRLIVTSGEQEGLTFPLLRESVSIGRATTNAEWEISLQDMSVSRPHARLDRIDSAWVIHDLGSANGTLVNGTSITEKGRLLRDGDVITVGGTGLLFRAS